MVLDDVQSAPAASPDLVDELIQLAAEPDVPREVLGDLIQAIGDQPELYCHFARIPTNLLTEIGEDIRHRDAVMRLCEQVSGIDAELGAAIEAIAGGRDDASLVLLAGLLLDDALPAELQHARETLGEATRALVMRLYDLGFTGSATRLASLLIADADVTSPELVRFASVARETGRLDRAIALLSLGVLLYPSDPLLRIERAKALVPAGHLAPAMRDVLWLVERAEVLELDVALGAADVLWQGGEEDRALALLEEMLARHPESCPLLLKMAQFRWWRSEAQGAEPLVRAALALEPQNVDAASFLAMLLTARGRAGEAISVLAALDRSAWNAAIANAFVGGALAQIWPTIPDYVDFALLDELDRVVRQFGDELEADRIWEAARISTILDRAASAHEQVTLATRRRSDTRPPEGQELALVRDLLRHTKVTQPETLALDVLGQILTTQGVVFSATARLLASELCFTIASVYDPADAAARINAGFCAIGAGRLGEASRHFEGIVRIYEDQMAKVAWPRMGEIAWPAAPFTGHEEAERLKPEGREWPLITVVTPSYNQAQYLEETILSVLRQGYPRLQYIIVDGSSTDGSVEIIERYRSQFETVIIEPDKGQSEAINKGLRLARGELVTWLNSDDMFAPGALHMVALSWLRSEADLTFGLCMPHRRKGFLMANLPQVTQDTFTRQHLSEIFKYWMKGFFFYQPEVIFSRRILEKVGLLDESLYYTMDYDFWLRCAEAHASVDAVAWPIALFRQHEQQKTSNLLDCMLEQAEVRDRHFVLRPPTRNRVDVRNRVRSALTQSPLRLGVISSRAGKIFSPDSAADLRGSLRQRGIDAHFVESAAQLRQRPSVVVKLIHLQRDVEDIETLRDSGFDGPVIGWFWDNHHHLEANFEVAEHLDIIVPGHKFASSYLRNREGVMAPSLPLCVTQWSQREAARFYPRFADRERSSDLYGGFVRYPFAKQRNKFIAEMMAANFPGIYFLDEGYLERYFGNSQQDRFKEWMQYKTSIVLPLANDMSQRLFDALLTGQVPIVPRNVFDLEEVFSPEQQEALPIIRLESYDIDAVRDAHARAVAAFDAGGAEGAMRRHLHALKHHCFPSAIEGAVEILKSISREL